MDDGSDALLRVVADVAPDFHDVAAGGIDDLAAALLELVHENGWRAKGRHDDHVLVGQGIVAGVQLEPWQGGDVHVAELAVHFLIVDDFADEEHPLFGKYPAGGVGHLGGHQLHHFRPPQIYPGLGGGGGGGDIVGIHRRILKPKIPRYQLILQAKGP